ncbi:MAG: CoA transferase [Alphaproteobacteria bacterium]|nr:MAG: CoA transferase [Alphaproteobacteria bacterium]
MAKLPLEHLTVLDLTLHRAGPTCARQFADWGAKVIKIEVPGGPPGEATGANRLGPDYQNLHRNKLNMTLNLKSQEGRALFLELARHADVVIENYRSDVKHRLGIAYEAVSKVNPRIVYGSIAGFGQDGPDAKRPGVDQIAQGMGGLMSITGEPGRGPMRVGIPIADLTTGLFLFQACLLALMQREQTGVGQWVHTSLLESQIFMLDFQAARWLLSGEVAKQAGNDHPTAIPTGVFPTSDGHINIAASGDQLYRRFCEAAGATELLSDPDYANSELRSRNRKALSERIARVTRTQSSARWVKLLNDAGVPCGPINSIDQTFAEPQVEHLGIAKPVRHPMLGDIKVVGQPITLTKAPQPAEYRPTPELSQHTDEILAGLGHDAESIAGLRARGVI